MVVAVFLSYNANNGLPFVPTYNIKVELPAGLGAAERRTRCASAGTRVGIVSALDAPSESRAPASVTAIAELKLEKKVEPLPANTTATVQSVSTIGLKYLELEKGNSSATIKAGRRSRSARPANR